MVILDTAKVMGHVVPIHNTFGLHDRSLAGAESERDPVTHQMQGRDDLRVRCASEEDLVSHRFHRRSVIIVAEPGIMNHDIS